MRRRTSIAKAFSSCARGYAYGIFRSRVWIDPYGRAFGNLAHEIAHFPRRINRNRAGRLLENLELIRQQVRVEEMCPGGDAPTRQPGRDTQIDEANAAKPADQRASIPLGERGTREDHVPLCRDRFCQDV